MLLSRHNEDDDELSFSSSCLPDNGQTELGMPQMRIIHLLQQSPVTAGWYELRAAPPQLLQTADIVNTAVSNTAEATAVSTGPLSAVAVGADAVWLPYQVFQPQKVLFLMVLDMVEEEEVEEVEDQG
jgi:hypothetical protein